MPVAYREITSGVVSRTRFTSQVANGKLWMPASGAAAIGYLDLTTEAYSELTTAVTSRTRRLSFMRGNTLYLPSESSATIGKVNTSTVSFSEIAMGSTARSWGDSGILVGDIFYRFTMNNAVTTEYIVGKYNVLTDAYSEVVKPRPAPTGGSITFTKPFYRPADAKIYMLAIADGAPYLCAYDPGDPTDAITLSAWAGTGVSPQAPVQVGNTIWWWDGTNDEIIPAPGGTVYTGSALDGARQTGQKLGDIILWPQTGASASSFTAFDTVARTVTNLVSMGGATRSRFTSQLVVDKLYLPHSGHASIGVVEELPLPPVPTTRRLRGFGMIRG